MQTFAEHPPMNPDLWSLAALLVALAVVWFLYHAGALLRSVREREEIDR